MPSENRKILGRIYEGWGRGDFSVGIPAFDPHIVMVIDPEIPDEGVYLGLDGMRGYTTRFLEAWKSLTIVPESFEEVGDTVVVEVRQTGVGLDSGAPVTLDYFHVWTFRGGKVVRLESVLREERARELSGLKPE